MVCSSPFHSAPLHFLSLLAPHTTSFVFNLSIFRPISPTASSLPSASRRQTMSDRDTNTQPTLNIPSLFAFAVISFFAIRYLFFSSSQNARNAPLASDAYPATASAGRRRVPLEKVETIAAMFPQLSRGEIEWDLQRNGGSVQATTERVLRDGRLSLVRSQALFFPDTYFSFPLLVGCNSHNALRSHVARCICTMHTELTCTVATTKLPSTIGVRFFVCI